MEKLVPLLGQDAPPDEGDPDRWKECLTEEELDKIRRIEAGESPYQEGWDKKPGLRLEVTDGPPPWPDDLE